MFSDKDGLVLPPQGSLTPVPPANSEFPAAASLEVAPIGIALPGVGPRQERWEVYLQDHLLPLQAPLYEAPSLSPLIKSMDKQNEAVKKHITVVETQIANPKGSNRSSKPPFSHALSGD